jgi:hypothetical protein
MTQRYDESAHISKLTSIEACYTGAVKAALAEGKTFWSTANNQGIGICDALWAAEVPFDGISALHCGIVTGMYALHTNNLHADHRIGVKIGQRLRKVAFP